MKSLFVFIDGTICDTRHRHYSIGTQEFLSDENVLADIPTLGSVECLQKLCMEFEIVYMGARPEGQRSVTLKWLENAGFPLGELFLAPSHEERLEIVGRLKAGHAFAAGIGDRCDDNELHLELGCMSIILKEFEGNWGTVYRHLLSDDKQ